MIFDSDRLPQDLFRPKSWKNFQYARTDSFQLCSRYEHDSTNE